MDSGVGIDEGLVPQPSQPQFGFFVGLALAQLPEGDYLVSQLTGFAPGGVVIGADGALYVTNKAILPGDGEVLKIRP